MSAARTPDPAPLVCWHDVTRERIRDIRHLWRGTCTAPVLLRGLFRTLTAELRFALSDEPCPVRSPVSWETWRSEVVDLHACRRMVRQNLPLAIEAAEVAAQRSRKIVFLQDRFCGMALNAIGRRRAERELEALHESAGNAPQPAFLEAAE